MTCAHCGASLAWMNASARFCSSLCRVRYSNEERRAAATAVRAIRVALARPGVTVGDIAALLP